MSDLPTCLCGAPLVLPDRAGYCCSDQACGMFDPDGDLTIGDWRHINAIVARKVTEAVEAERPKWQRAHTLWAENVAAERDAAREALRLAVPIVTSDLEQWEMADEFTPEYRRKGMGMATTALRAIVAILPDALDGAPEWIVEAVKQEKPE